MREFIITDAADQEFTTVIAGKRCTLRFRYNVGASQRWSFDLKIGDEQVLVGRRVVLGCDLIDPFAFGIGAIFAVDYAETGAVPDRTALPARTVRVFHADPDEVAAAKAA